MRQRDGSGRFYGEWKLRAALPQSVREVTRRQSHGNEFGPYHKSQYKVVSRIVALMIISESRMG